MNRWIPRMAVLVAACFAVGPAEAIDEEPLEPPKLERYLRWGMLRVRPTLSFSNLGYDDNVFFATGDEPKQGDYRVTLSPRLEGLLLLGDRTFLVFDEKLDYTVYREFHDQNYFNQTGTARLTVPRKRIGFFTELGLIRRKDRPNSELDIRPERREARAGVGVILKLGWRTYAEIERAHSDWSFSDPDFRNASGATLGELLDRVEQGLQFRLGYRLTDRTRLTLEAATTTIDFDNPDVNRDSREKRFLPGVDFGEGGRLAGSLQIGRARIETRDGAQTDYSGTVGEATLAYHLGSGTTIRLGGYRDVGFAVYQGNLYYLDRAAEARALHFLNRLVGVEAGGSRGKLTFPGASVAIEREDHVRQYDVGVRLRLLENALGRRVEYSLSVGRYRRESTLDILNQSRTTVGLAAVVGF